MTERNLAELNNLMAHVLARLDKLESGHASHRESLSLISQMRCDWRLLRLERRLSEITIGRGTLTAEAEAAIRAEAMKPGELLPTPAAFERPIPVSEVFKTDPVPEDVMDKLRARTKQVDQFLRRHERLVPRYERFAEEIKTQVEQMANLAPQHEPQALDGIQRTLEFAFGHGYARDHFDAIRKALAEAMRPDGVDEMDRD